MDTSRTQPGGRAPDRLLAPLLAASSDTEFRRRLQQTVERHAMPVIRKIVEHEWSVRLDGHSKGQTMAEADAEDSYSDAIALLLTRLEKLRGSSPSDAPIADLRGYSATIAYNACDSRLRRKYRSRWSLSNKIRFLLSHTPGLAAWEDKDGRRICGFVVWRDAGKPLMPSDRIAQLREKPRHVADVCVPPAASYSNNPARVVAALFDWVGHPVELKDLISALAEIWNVRDDIVSLCQETLDGVDWTPEASRNTSPQGVAERRETLQWLWSEILQLPVNQRAALLLNMRDGHGQGEVSMIPVAGVATIREIAAALDIAAERFAELWGELPIEDAVIAEILGVSRQQVINLRKSARERLMRRYRGQQEGTGLAT